MDRAKLALTLLSIEFNNAKARQNKRLTRLEGNPDIMSLAIAGELSNARLHMRLLRRAVLRIMRAEIIERKRRRMDKPARDRSAGVNARQVGTYGR